MLLDHYLEHCAEREIDTELYRKAATATLADLKALVAAGANPNAPVYNDIKDDFYAIHRAALNPDLEVLKYFVSLGVDPCCCDSWGREPLSFAVRRNPIAHARYLAGLGNRPDYVDYDGESVIAEAALNPHVEVLDFLIENGADINAGGYGNLPFEIALGKGTVDRVRYFFEHGACVECVDSLTLFCAPIENVRFLLGHGYDPNARDDDGTKVIDHLDSARRAIFEEFGGSVQDPDAEKYHLTYPEEMPK